MNEKVSNGLGAVPGAGPGLSELRVVGWLAVAASASQGPGEAGTAARL